MRSTSAHCGVNSGIHSDCGGSATPGSASAGTGTSRDEHGRDGIHSPSDAAFYHAAG